LSSADEELNYFQSLGVTLDKPSTRRQLFDLLGTQDYGVLHFACHGKFDIDQPGESVVQLPDRTLLQSDDLYNPEIEKRFRTNRPLVFLNACHSGRTGPTLTGLGGWAERFIDMGCGAFIGCGWEVADPLAAEFAIAFYEGFRDGKTLGQAVHSARKQIRRKEDPANSTWLAYYLYGNPNCRLKGSP
jgi:CHAT domain-containing protein